MKTKYVVFVAAQANEIPAGVLAPVSQGQWKTWNMWATATEHESPADACMALAKGQNYSEKRLMFAVPFDQCQQFWVAPERHYKADQTGNLARDTST